jgi:hypothetical protein
MDWALLVASLALVAVTVVYTWHTRAMSAEMKATRLLSVHPRLSIGVKMRSGVVGEIEIINVGHGPAIEPELTLTIPALEDKRRWRAHLLLPGESVGFMLESPGEPHKVVSMDEARELGVVVEIRGTVGDLYGTRHDVRDTFELAQWWSDVVAAQQRYRQEHEVIVERELKKLREATEGVKKELARAASRLDSPEQD